MGLRDIATRLTAGETVTFRPSGHSMTGIINHRQTVTVSPVSDPDALTEGDVVLVKVRGAWLLHRVKHATRTHLTIANARGRENGRVTRDKVAGVVTVIHPN